MTNSNNTMDKSSLICLLILIDIAASKLENSDNLMDLLTLAQIDASKLEDENDKLQEALRNTVRSMNGCKFYHSYESCDFDECIYEVRARELGIEVN
jgi:hypothetical protein